MLSSLEAGQRDIHPQRSLEASNEYMHRDRLLSRLAGEHPILRPLVLQPTDDFPEVAPRLAREGISCELPHFGRVNPYFPKE